MITSSANPQVKQAAALNRKARLRRELGLFVAEGVKMYEEAPASWIRKVYVSESFREAGGTLREDVVHEVVDDRVFASMCDTRTPQGVLCLLRIPSYSPEEVLGGPCPLVIALEDLQDPGNVGTILRTAEGAGATGIVLGGNTADIFNPKTIRATMGSVYRMPFLVAEDFPACLREMKARGIRTFAAHLAGTRSYREEDYTGPAAFLIGNEGNGLSDGAVRQADRLIRIPMRGRVESLNAAIAAAVLMYEAQGQRS